MLDCTDPAVLQLVNELEGVVIIELCHVLNLVPVRVAQGLMQPDDLLSCQSFVEFLVFEFLWGLDNCDIWAGISGEVGDNVLHLAVGPVG